MTGFSQPERRGLERSQTAQPHPDADLLTAFSEQTLTAREREHLLAHLAVCPACREVVSLAAPPSEISGPVAVSEPSVWNWPILRWGAVAASAVIVVIAVSLAKFERPTTPQVQVATETSPVNTPAAPVASTATAEPTPSAGMKAPQVRYEKVAPKQQAKDLDALTDLTSSNVILKKEVAPGASGAVMGGATAASAPMRAAPEHADEAKNTPAVFADKATTANEALAKMKAVPPPPPPVATQSVDVSSASSAVDQVQVATAEVAPKGRQPSAIRNAAPMAAREMRMNAFTLDQRWQVTPEGYLLSSTDEGKNWVRQLPDLRFTQVQTIGPHVWACGPDGILMHSMDGGMSWIKVVPTDQKDSLQGNITRIAFTDLNHGTIETSRGEHWTTVDAGKSWKKQ